MYVATAYVTCNIGYHTIQQITIPVDDSDSENGGGDPPVHYTSGTKVCNNTM